jgi:hypothetical protein
LLKYKLFAYVCVDNYTNKVKTLKQIKAAAEKGDFTTVARLTGIGASLVREVIKGNRTDHHGIQKAFSDYLTAKEKLKLKAQRRNQRATV